MFNKSFKQWTLEQCSKLWNNAEVPLRFTSSNQEQICGIHYQIILLKFIPYFNLKTNLSTI
jgi:hypothetical protein